VAASAGPGGSTANPITSRSRFNGDIDEGLARESAYELEGVEAGPSSSGFRAATCFGGNKPHSLFAAVEESPELRRLQSIHERICQTLGLPAEQRKLRPMSQLAGWKEPNLRALPPLSLRPITSTRARVFEVGRFVLFSSARRVGVVLMRSRNLIVCREGMTDKATGPCRTRQGAP